MYQSDAEASILHPRTAQAKFTYHRHAPDPHLAEWVLNFWTVSWDLTEPYTAQVLPLPTVNVTVTNTEADVTGLVRRRYDRHLTGRGYAVGARFRPACFRPFLGSSVSALTDTHRPIADVLGVDTAALAAAVAATSDARVRVRLLTDFLLAKTPNPDPLAQRLAWVVTKVIGRPDIVRVHQVAELAGVGTRTLQRQFAEYVGAGPKWLIDRRRVLDTAARVGADPAPVWAQLAAELGYADQAHLSRTFSTVLGTPPSEYSR